MALSFIQVEKKILEGDVSGSGEKLTQDNLYNFKKTESR